MSYVLDGNLLPKGRPVAVAATEKTRVGTTVADKYRLSRVLGRGGMGVVYEAEHLVTGRRVAIKVMHPESEVGADAARRFMNEASSAGRIQHPNVVEVLDAGQDPADGSLFIVLELLAGIDLATYLIRYERLLPVETLTVVCQVLQALVVADRVGIVHRDIKPENIFLARQQSGDTHVKVVDFGISKAIHPDRDIPLSITRNNTTVGTPHYMSPEQARGDAIDTRADLWALGVVMYECLTGRLPFDGENFNLQIVAVVTGQHPPAMDLGVDPELSAVIDRCLEKDRNRRYAHAGEMLADLRGYIDRHPEVKVRAALLREPPEHGAAIPSARAGDPTTSVDLDPANFRAPPSPPLPPGVRNTDGDVPVFPGMVPIEDEEQADNAPTTVRVISPRGDIPRALDSLTGKRTWTSTSAASPGVHRAYARSRSVWLTLGAVVLVAVGAGTSFAVMSSTRSSSWGPNVQPSRVTLRFVGIHPGAKLTVGSTSYHSDTVFAARGSTPTPVHIESQGYIPLEFTILPDRDQNVALPPMQRARTLPPPTEPPVPEASAPSPARTTALAAVPTPPPTPGTHTSAALSPAARSTLSVGANPRCTVTVDGRLVGVTPLVGKPVSPGSHRIGCIRPGQRTTVRTVQVAPGAPTRLIF